MSKDLPIFRFEGVKKAFDRKPVLRGIDMEVLPDEVTVILGPSGAGKSVLLRHALGLEQPDEGRIYFEGRDLTAMTEEEIYSIRKRMGMLFQDGALFDSMTVFENVAFPIRQHRRLSQGEIRNLVSCRLDQVGLSDAAEKLPGELSGGMKKRAGLARALVLDPDILLFDEPSSGLDPVTAAAIDELILETREDSKVACLIISHDVASTFRIADRIGMLYDGKLLAFAAKATIKESTDPALRQFFERSAHGPIQTI